MFPQKLVFSIAILLLGANLRASLTAVGPILTKIQSNLDLSASVAGLLNSIPPFIFAVLSPFIPVLARKTGMDRAIIMALLLLISSIFIRSSQWFGGLWLGTLLLSAAIAICNVLLPILIKKEFSARLSLLLTAAYIAIMGVAGALASGTVVFLAGERAQGWRVALVYPAFLAIFTLFFWLPRWRVPSSTALQTETSLANEYQLPWKSLLAWQVALFMGLQSTVFYTLIAWFSAYAVSRGIPLKTAGFYLFFYQLFGVIASLAISFVLLRTKDLRFITVMASVLSFIGVFGLMSAPYYALTWISIAGVAGGVSMVISIALFGLRTKSPAQATALSGMAQSVAYLMSALGPILVGFMYDLTQAWLLPFVFLLGSILLQIVISIFVGKNRLIT